MTRINTLTKLLGAGKRALVGSILAGAALAAVSLAAVTAVEAAAPKMCIPQAIGVPGQPGAADWWTAGQNVYTLFDKPSDPRWRGAMSLDYGIGTTSDAELRAQFDQQGGTTYLLLSW